MDLIEDDIVEKMRVQGGLTILKDISQHKVAAKY